MPKINLELVVVAFALVALNVGSASCAAAQADSGAGNTQVQHRNNCRLAHRILVMDGRANKYEWAVGYSSGCGALGGEATAAALPRYRTVSAPGGQLEKLA